MLLLLLASCCCASASASGDQGAACSMVTGLSAARPAGCALEPARQGFCTLVPAPPLPHSAQPTPPPQVVPYLKRDGLRWKLEGRHAARQALLTSGLLPTLAAPTPSGEALEGRGVGLAEWGRAPRSGPASLTLGWRVWAALWRRAAPACFLLPHAPLSYSNPTLRAP